MLPPGERRRAEAMNVLLPGDRRRAEAEGMLLLRNIIWGVRYRGNAATGGTSQGGSHERIIIGGGSYKVLLPGENVNRKLIGFVRNKYYYTKFIIFSKRKRGNIIIKDTLYEAYNTDRILLPKKNYKRKPQNAVIGE